MGSPSGLSVYLDAIDEAFDRKSWHGTNLRGSLRGVTVKQALWRPQPGRHNVYELTVHCAYWKYVVWRRLTGARRGAFPLKGSNYFPAPEELSEDGWKLAVELLTTMHLELRSAVAGARPGELAAAKLEAMVRGIAAHDLYHAGQIQLLKRLQSGGL
jgi:hypothetical protein